MIVRNLYVVRVSFPPPEADTPLVVDPDAVLAGPVAAEFLQPIPGGNSEVVELFARVNLDELSPGRPLYLNRPSPYHATRKDAPRFFVGECFDHARYDNA